MKTLAQNIKGLLKKSYAQYKTPIFFMTFLGVAVVVLTLTAQPAHAQIANPCTGTGDCDNQTPIGGIGILAAAGGVYAFIKLRVWQFWGS